MPLLCFIFLFLLPLAFSSISNTKPGCPDRCGSLLIPYPFGVGQDCSLEPSFDIFCNDSVTPPKAYYLHNVRNDMEVFEINTSYIRIRLPNLVLSCYGGSGWENGIIVRYGYFAIGNQFTWSDMNWVFGYGCDDMVGVVGEVNGRNFGGGCTAYCDSRNDTGGVASCPDDSNGYVLGSGCCRTPIPRGTTNLTVSLTDVHTNWRASKLYRCSIAFLGEKAIIPDLPLDDLNNSTKFGGNWQAEITPPVVIDWRMGAENCSEARNTTTYACQDNSECVDFNASVRGYHCRCREGFHGNAYLTPGCEDINECTEINPPCDSNAICVNAAGSVNCSCREGYYGDGKKNGTGCTRQQQSKVNNALIGLGSGLGFLLVLLMYFRLHKVLQRRKNRKHKEKLFKHLLWQQQTNEGTFGTTKLFSAKELDKATDHFNENRILGQGGQGTVFKGMLTDGKIVAIKKLNQVDEDQLEQFINEIVILSQTNHRNVVKLLGCCLATEIPLLVYEFMPNGTLFDLIHDHNTEFPVTWNIRLKIATDIAEAVAYLHSASSTPIYHRDIKSSNILLDRKYAVKVSDFGTSKFVAVDQTHLTTLVKGTIGYLDPEYFHTGQYTDKSDVYSFGVVVVELLTGQRPISLERTEEQKSLATRFIAYMEADDLDEILDAQVSEEGTKEAVIAVARLAQRCLNMNGRMRPTMREVATELEICRKSQMSSAGKDEPQEALVHEVKPSNIDCTWTTSGTTEVSTSDAHPFISEIV